MSKRELSLLVEDIMDSAHKILNYTSSLSFENFTKDGKTIDAVFRNVEIIGKATFSFLFFTGCWNLGLVKKSNLLFASFCKVNCSNRVSPIITAG